MTGRNEALAPACKALRTHAAICRHSDCSAHPPDAILMLMARYTEQDIESAIRTVASLIDRFGDAYWPILERLEQELESRRSRAARLQRYLRTSRLLSDVEFRTDAKVSACPARSPYVRAKGADMDREV